MKISSKFWKNLNSNKNSISLDEDLKEFINYKSTNKKIISVDNISQIYDSKFKDKKIIFENLNFDIYEGDKIALLGGNGAGKTTIVEIIAGFKKPSSGSVHKFFDKNTVLSKQIGIQFQDLSFPKSLKVKDILKFIVNIDENDISEEELKEIIDIFQINSFINTKISKISGGQQQRLNVLLSLIIKPKLLFLDEFTTGLDIASKNIIKNFIISFCKKNKMIIVIISHDISIISEMVNRVILIGNKKKLIDSSIKDIEKEFGSFEKMVKKYII